MNLSFSLCLSVCLLVFLSLSIIIIISVWKGDYSCLNIYLLHNVEIHLLLLLLLMLWYSIYCWCQIGFLVMFCFVLNADRCCVVRCQPLCWWCQLLSSMTLLTELKMSDLSRSLVFTLVLSAIFGDVWCHSLCYGMLDVCVGQPFY